MNKIILLTLLSSIVLVACNSNQQIDNKANSITQKSTIDLSATYKKIDYLEILFGNENYLLIDKNDSSYLYFSRLGKDAFYTHSYHLKNGDSTALTLDTIQIDATGKINWNWKNKQLILENCDENKALWQSKTDSILKVDFIKNTNNSLSLITQNKILKMQKTLPISLFLVRSKYDYEHKTHFAFDTSNFTKKH